MCIIRLFIHSSLVPPAYLSNVSVFSATSSLLPLRVGLAKVYCGEERFWNEDGHSTTPTILEGIVGVCISNRY